MFLTLNSIRANEEAFKEEVEKIYTTGPSWTRVNSLVDLQQKTDRKDVGRMKVFFSRCTPSPSPAHVSASLNPFLQSVLTQIKEAPPAHMSAKK